MPISNFNDSLIRRKNISCFYIRNYTYINKFFLSFYEVDVLFTQTIKIDLVSQSI